MTPASVRGWGVLRAQVDYQHEQQSLISTTYQVAKDKLALARAIGLPLDPQFRLTDSEPYAALDNLDPQAAFTQALKNRKDLAAASEQVAAAQAQKTAAWAEQLPTVKFSGDYGDIGETVGHSHETFTATGKVEAPILQIAKTRGEEDVADASYHQAADKLADQIQQVNADIRDSMLDIQSAAKLVDAAESDLDLANEELSEAQQRFHAGVSDNLPVSQAQSETEQANDQYISALYQHNTAKLSLARALGVAETNLKDLGGKVTVADTSPENENTQPEKKTVSAPEPPPSSSRRFIVIGVILVLVLGAAFFYWRSTYTEDTDDAQVDGNLSQVSSRITGRIGEGVRRRQPDGSGWRAAGRCRSDRPGRAGPGRSRPRQRAGATYTQASTNVPITSITVGTNVNAASDVKGSADSVAQSRSRWRLRRRELRRPKPMRRRRRTMSTATLRSVKKDVILEAA